MFYILPLFNLTICTYDDVFLIFLIPKIFFDIELDDTIDDLSLVNIDTVQEIAFKEGVKIVVESVIGGN